MKKQTIAGDYFLLPGEGMNVERLIRVLYPTDNNKWIIEPARGGSRSVRSLEGLTKVSQSQARYILKSHHSFVTLGFTEKQVVRSVKQLGTLRTGRNLSFFAAARKLKLKKLLVEPKVGEFEAADLNHPMWKEVTP